MITFTYSSFGKTAESYSSPLGHDRRTRTARLTRSIRPMTGRVPARHAVRVPRAVP